jgi:hypothetical protein
MRLSTIAALALALTVTAGCSSYKGLYPIPVSHGEIVLHENDFRTQKSGVEGKAECAYIFGIPLGTPEIVSTALNEVRNQAVLDGQAAQLVNFTQDNVTFSILGIYTVQKIHITADVIEFTK